MRFAWDGANPPSLRRLETVVHNEVGHAGVPALVSLLDEEIICFVEVSPGAARPDNVVSLGRSVLDRAELQYPESGPRCGIGTPAALLEDWPVSLSRDLLAAIAVSPHPDI